MTVLNNTNNNNKADFLRNKGLPQRSVSSQNEYWVNAPLMLAVD